MGLAYLQEEERPRALSLSPSHVRTAQGEGPICKARVLTRNSAVWHLDLGLLASRTMNNTFLLVKHPQSVIFCYDSLN